MANNSVTQIKLLLIATIILILMSCFWLYLNKNQDDLAKTAMASTAAQFTSKVLLIHSQWMMTGKPEHVVIKQRQPGSNSDYQQLIVKVNKFGWPDLQIEHDACQRIWQRILGVDMKILNKPIIVIERRINTKHKSRVCRYQFDERKYIEYHSLNGKIINKN
ncbi:hypothetical protein AADZ86_07905 [Colwelliaceae bacterium BS250]